MTRIFVSLFVSSILLLGTIVAFGQNISAEARRHFDRGMAAVEMAKSAEGFDVAISEFKQAATLAPDWADAYYNLGKVQEAAEKYTDAITSFRKYLQLAPNAPDAGEVASLINKIEYKAENVMTVAKVVSVLGQLSTWSAKESSGFNAYVRGKSATAIEVPTSVLWSANRSEPDVFRKDLVVNAPRVSFHYTIVLMDKKNVANISRDIDVELEVVSLSKVKVREVAVWRYWAIGGDPVTRISTYELVPSNALRGVDEQFDRKTGAWEFRDAEASAVISDGKLTFENRKKGINWNIHKDAYIDTKRDFTIETEMKFISGDEDNFYGFLWGRKDASNFYYFGVTANGNYAYRKWLNGAWSEVISYKPSPVIKTGVNANKLAVSKRGGKLEFYINDKLVDTAMFEEFTGEIGFHLNHYMKIEIDYLRVTYQ